MEEGNIQKKREEKDRWTEPCESCASGRNADQCALGCSLLLIWTGRRIKS